MTQGEKLLARLAQHKGKLIRLTVLIGTDGEPMIVVIEEESRAEPLVTGGWPEIKRLTSDPVALIASQKETLDIYEKSA